MAKPLTTDWSKMRYKMFLVFSVSALLASTVATGLTTSGRQKRQLFREHLLPHYGGKIPESAFNPDRIILNKYNQNGFASPDGHYLEQRHPDVHHSPKRLFPNTIKVFRKPENRFVAPPGRFSEQAQVDTTYLISRPVQYVIWQRPYNYLQLPSPPWGSLEIMKQTRFRKIKNQSSWDEFQDDLPSKIFMELSPYLHNQLHATD